MKQPEQMNDEELAVAVVNEILEWKEGKGSYKNCWPYGLGYITTTGLPDFILFPSGRDAIEDELERRGWGHECSNPPPLEENQGYSDYPERRRGVFLCLNII